MGWLSDIFSTNKSTTTGRGQALTSTHEAFSLPTSSPGLSSRSNDRFGTPEPPESSYTYPPPSSARGSYDFVPSPTTRSRQQTSLLPMHNNSFSPPSQYPPLAQTWGRLRAWLTAEYPELGDTLNYGILPAELAQIEMQMGGELPAPVRESYLQVDGQEPESSAGCSAGLFFGLTLLPLEDVLEEWRFWREVDDDPQTGANPRLRENMQSIPPGWVRREYSCRGWIPLITDKGGNYLGVDLNPGEGGAVGQVIVFGRDIDTKVVMWRGDGPGGWAKWLAAFVEDLESGEGYELGGEREGSDDEDDIGYGGYFYDGHGRGHHGDGGGDTGTNGLRLSGEYRGWSVLEAWADRSIRRWFDAGVIPDTSAATMSDEKGKGKMGLGVLDLAETTKTSDAEVPIPVLDSPTAMEPAEAQHSRSLPSISVTKAPAPKPFALPTEQDIYAGSADEYLPDGDLEAGHGALMQEAPDVHASTSELRSPRSPGYADPLEATKVPPSPSQATAPAHAVRDSASIPLADITDLLGDDSTPASTSHLPPLPEITVDEPPKATSAGDEEESTQGVQSGAGSDAGSSSEAPSSPTSGVSTEEFETVEAPTEMPTGR